MNIYQTMANEETTEQFSERRLWTAVLLQALEDWKSGNRRLSKAADNFFFESSEDFARACRGAGLAPESVMSKLRIMKPSISQGGIAVPLAA